MTHSREVRELARHINSLERRLDRSLAPQLRHSSLEGGAIIEYDEDGTEVGRIGEQDDGSHVYLPWVGPVPPIPSKPLAIIKPGLFRVGWDGVFVDPTTYVDDPTIVAPHDFSRVSAHVGAVADFVPEVGPDSSTRIGTFETSGGQFTHLPEEPGTYYVRLVTHSLAGKVSEPSVSTEIEVPPALDQAELEADLEALRTGLEAAADWIAESGATLDTLLGGDDVIPEAVVDHLWANVVRARKITADMMVVGGGENLITDPSFLDDDLLAARNAASTPEWTRAEDDPFSSVQASLPSFSSALLDLRAPTEDGFTPVTPGHTYRIRYRATAPVSLGIVTAATLIEKHGDDTQTTATFETDDVQHPTPEGAWIEGTWTAPDSCVGVLVQATCSTSFATTLHIAAPSVVSMTDPSLLVDGTVGARKIIAEEVGAEVGEFVHAHIGNLVAGELEVMMGIKTGGGVISGDLDHRYTSLDETGLKVYVVTDEDGESDTIPTIDLSANGDNFLTFTDADGNALGGFSAEGRVSGAGLDVSGDSFFDGNFVLNGEPLDGAHLDGFGPVVNGRALLDDQHIAHTESHPALGDQNKWTLGLAYGDVGQSLRSLAGFGNVNTAQGRYIRELCSITFEAQHARSYRLDINFGQWRRQTASGRGSASAMILRTRASTGNAAYNSGTIIQEKTLYVQNQNQYQRDETYVILDCRNSGGDIPPGQISLVTYIDIYADQIIEYGSTCTMQTLVTDLGRSTRIDQNPNPTGIWREWEGESAPPTPTPPRERRYTTTYNANWTHVWSQHGYRSNAAHHKNRARAGRGGSSFYRSYIGFPSMTGDLSGATIERVEAYLYPDAGSASTTVPWGLHNRLGASTGSEPSRSTSLGNRTWRRTQGQWVTLPTSVHAGIRSGTLRGLWIGSNSSNTHPIMNFRRHGQGNAPKIRVTYRK